MNKVEKVESWNYSTLEYAVKNEQYSRMNNLSILGPHEDEGENLGYIYWSNCKQFWRNNGKVRNWNLPRIGPKRIDNFNE